jgi:hypothetical protein
MKISASIFLVGFLSFGIVVAAEQKTHDIAPRVLNNTHRAMQTAGFWIHAHANASQVILNAKQISSLNKNIQEDLVLTKDVFNVLPGFNADQLTQGFLRTIHELSQKDYFTASGARDSAPYLDHARLNMYISGVVAGMVPRYGLVVHYADVRFLPSDVPLYESAGDVDFDQMQNSSLDVGTPVAILHQSLDKKWYYVLSPIADGWVQADRVAIGDVKRIKDYVNAQDFVVAVAAKADIFLNDAKTVHHDYVRMGTRLPFIQDEEGHKRVQIPTLDHDHKLFIVNSFVHADEFHPGYLPYTPQNILTQAFKMINQPYGWGGMNGEQDCSAFLVEVFGTVGIILPRDSKNQAQVGKVLAAFKPNQKEEERLKSFEEATGGKTVLSMKGHIMLYLGSIEKRPYAIHSVWAYRERDGDRDVPKVINRVVVSDLSLGEGSQKGSLLKRLTKIIAIQNP